MSMKNLSLVCSPFELSKSDATAEVTLPRILTMGFFNPAYLQPAESAPVAVAPDGSRHARAASVSAGPSSFLRLV